MSRYRYSAMKASAVLWVLVLLADAGWIVTSGAAAVAATVAALFVAAALVAAAAALIGRTMVRQPAPIPVRVRRRP